MNVDLKTLNKQKFRVSELQDKIIPLKERLESVTTNQWIMVE